MATQQEHYGGYVYRIATVAALGGLLFGYDTGVVNGAVGFLVTKFSLGAAETGWVTSSALLGCIVGAGIAGMLSDLFGRKKVLIMSAILFLVSALGSAIPQNVPELVIARIVGGIGIGFASMTSPLYIAEVAPARLRGRLVSVNQFMIIFGMLIVFLINYWIGHAGEAREAGAQSWIVETVNRFTGGPGELAWNAEFGWRAMFGSELIPALVFFFMLFFVPESPRYLMKRQKDDRARAILTRVEGATYAQAEMVEIREAILAETGSIRDLFRAGMKLALIIGVVLAVLQQVTGINVYLYYGTEIFKALGEQVDIALLKNVSVGAVNLLFTVLAIFIVDKVGRKPLLMIGAAGMGVCLMAISYAAARNIMSVWVLGFVLGYVACFAISMGPVVWVVLSEIFPTRIRGRAMSIATVALWIACYGVSQTFPMLEANIGLSRTMWIYASMCLVTVLFVGFLLPETKRMSLEQIERHWYARDVKNG